MKVILVNPPRDHSISSEVPTTVNAETNTIPPLGLLYLEAYLHAHSNHEVEIFDCLAEHWHLPELETRLKASQPDLVGITGHTHDLVDMLLVTQMVKRILPECATWWGGPHVSDFPRQCMTFACLDGCIPFEGEAPFCETVNAVEKGEDLRQVRGIYFRDQDGEVVYTGARIVTANLDEIPFPRRDCIDYKKYHYVLGNQAVATSLLTSRGCPYKCCFCNTPGRHTWRWRSAKSIVDEMEECANLGIHEIYIVDDTFNVRHNRTLEICKAIQERGIKVNWNIRARVNLLTAETVEAMQKAGCTRVHVGVESGTDEGMAALNKALTTAQVRRGFNLLKKSGMATVCYFMIGCPHEKTVADIMQTVSFAIELDPDYALFGVLTPYPQTAVYEEGVKRGIIDPQNWERFVTNPRQDFKPQVWTESFTGEQLGELCDSAFKRFYIRPKQMFRKLLEIQNFKDLARKLKAGWEIFKL